MREACGWRVDCLNTTPIPTTTNRCVTRPSSKPMRGSKCCLPTALIPLAPTHRRAPWTSTISEPRRCCSRRARMPTKVWCRTPPVRRLWSSGPASGSSTHVLRSCGAVASRPQCRRHRRRVRSHALCVRTRLREPSFGAGSGRGRRGDHAVARRGAARSGSRRRRDVERLDQHGESPGGVPASALPNGLERRHVAAHAPSDRHRV